MIDLIRAEKRTALLIHAEGTKKTVSILLCVARHRNDEKKDNDVRIMTTLGDVRMIKRFWLAAVVTCQKYARILVNGTFQRAFISI